MYGVIHITVTCRTRWTRDAICVYLKQRRWSLQVWGLICSPWAMWGEKGLLNCSEFGVLSPPAPLSLSPRFYPVTWFLLLLSVHSCRISLFVSGLRLRAPVHISKSISRSEAQRTLSLCHDDKFAEPSRSECNAGKWSHRSCGSLWSTNEWASGCEEFSLHLFLLLWLLLLSVSYIFPFFLWTQGAL